MFVPRSLLTAGLALLPVRVAAVQRIRAVEVAAGPLVANLGERAIRQRTPNDISDAERVNCMRALLVEAFDVQAISKLVLGIYWRRTTEDQRAGFLKLYKTSSPTVTPGCSRNEFRGHQASVGGRRRHHRLWPHQPDERSADRPSTINGARRRSHAPINFSCHKVKSK